MLISTHPIFLLIGNSKTLDQLKQVHSQSITQGLVLLYPSLILTKILYTFTLLTTSLPSLAYASWIFYQIPLPSTFSYNTIIRAHTLLSSPLSAVLFFLQMRRKSVPPDAHTFPFALKACTHLRPALPFGRSLHSQAITFGFGSNIFLQNTLIHLYSNSNSLIDARQVFDETLERDVVSYNTLIHGFIKAGDTSCAREIFDEMPVRDAVSWGSLIAGYTQRKQCKEAIELFDQMLVLGVKPDDVALVSALSACVQVGALEKGEFIHNHIERNGIRLNVFLLTGLVDMYAKCGRIDIAREVFEGALYKNLFTWNAMVVGLAMNGYGELALEYFSRMSEMGVQPDGVTFLGVLVGCSHSGLVDKARQIFHEMESVYGVHRELKHFGCMADLLGRAGLVEETMEMIKGMPMEGDIFVWSGLLGGCRMRGNVEVAEIAAKYIMDLDPEDGGVYSIMANIYANAKRWEDVAKMRRLMNVTRINKNAGCSIIHVNGVAHEFIAGDTLHPQVDEIYLVLNGIGCQKFQGDNGLSKPLKSNT